MGSRRETYSVLGLALVVILVAAAFLVWESRSQPGGKAKIIGELTYRYRIAQRRNSSSVIWYDVDPGDQLRTRDSIRTDAQSEASVKLGDGTRIEMDPDSMIVLNVGVDSPSVELIKGSAVIENTAGRAPAIRSQGTTIQSEGRLRVSKSADGFEAESTSSIRIQDNTQDAWVDSGVAVVSGGRVSPKTRSISPEQPADNARFFPESELVRVAFQWRPAGIHRLEIAADREFQNILRRLDVTGNTASVEMGEGIYYWRIGTGTSRSEVRKFRVIRVARVGLVLPEDGQRFADSGSPVRFQWRTSRLDGEYRLEVARDSAFSDFAEIRLVKRDSVTLPMRAGEYFWRLHSLGSVEGARSVSEVRRFRVGQEIRKEPEKTAQPPDRIEAAKLPHPLIPAAGTAVDMAAQSALIFRWSAVPGAASYRVRMTHAATGAVVIDQEVSGTELAFTDLSKLDEGEFIWKVSAKVAGGPSDVVTGPEGRFRIVLSEKLERPQLNIQ